jgi:hypothetical protein
LLFQVRTYLNEVFVSSRHFYINYHYSQPLCWHRKCIFKFKSCDLNKDSCFIYWRQRLISLIFVYNKLCVFVCLMVFNATFNNKYLFTITRFLILLKITNLICNIHCIFFRFNPYGIKLSQLLFQVRTYLNEVFVCV